MNRENNYTLYYLKYMRLTLKDLRTSNYDQFSYIFVERRIKNVVYQNQRKMKRQHHLQMKRQHHLQLFFMMIFQTNWEENC